MPAIGREAAKALRRTHRKSRMGCAFCRRRRIKAGRKCALNTQLTIIKCDERKPACANCTRRDVPCEYSNDAVEPRQLQRSSSTTPVEVYSSETPNGQDASSSNGIQTTTPTSGQSLAHDSSLNSGTLNITDLELLHAWENSTAPSLAKFVSSLDGVVTLWQKTVPEIGFDYPFVLHACLAISATHLSRFKRGRADFYRSASERHWSQAFSAVTAQIPSASDASYHAFFTFSMLSCMYKLAKGPQPGDYLAFGAHDSDGEGSEWHTYYKGFHSFLELGLDALRVGPLGQLFDITQRKTRKFWLPEAPPDADAVADLRRLCGEVVEEEQPEFGVYTTAIDNLARVFAVVYAEQREGEYGIFVWILNIKEELIVCIQQREPMALVIFAYFVVLLEELSGWWILEGWVHHVLGGIYDALPVGARAWISWPMAQTGWLPP